MSTYAYFFVRHGDDFIPLGDFSRNSIVYQLIDTLHTLPWEKITPLTQDTLDRLVVAANTKQDEIRCHIRTEKAHMDSIKDFNNAIEEKMDAILERENIIHEYEQDISEIQYAKSYFSFLAELIDAVRWDKRREDINIDEYIYAGIEIGTPTVRDVINDAT